MSHLDILLPFGLPPADLARDLLRELKAPALATLIARAQPSSRKTFDDLLHALPHEKWLGDRFGFEHRFPLGSSPPVATATMAALRLTQDEGVWFILHPVSLHITSSRLILTDPRKLELSEQESRALFDAAQPLFLEAGKALVYGDPQTWFVRSDDWHDLRTSTPDVVVGQNIDGSMPHGSGERDWRKLQNEVQMHWHPHPVNAEREGRKLKPVNSIWLWGGAPAGTKTAPSRYRQVFNLRGGMRGFGQFAAGQTQADRASEIVAAAPEHGLLILDSLIEPALGSEWRNWLDRIEALEADWFAPLLAAMRARKIDRVSLILTHRSSVSEYTASKHSLRKFWRKPALARLLP